MQRTRILSAIPWHERGHAGVASDRMKDSVARSVAEPNIEKVHDYAIHGGVSQDAGGKFRRWFKAVDFNVRSQKFQCNSMQSKVGAHIPDDGALGKILAHGLQHFAFVIAIAQHKAV